MSHCADVVQLPGTGSGAVQTGVTSKGGIHMTDQKKGFSMVLGPDEGDSFWQPIPATGYATNKIINPVISSFIFL